MSFDIFQFESAIYARLNTGVILAAVQGVYNTVAPPEIKVGRGLDPFVVFFMVSGSFENTFVNNIGESTYQVSVYDHRLNDDISAKNVLADIFGDSEGTDNTPTIGLARWKVSPTGDAATAMMVPESFGTQHSEDHLHYWMTFSITTQEA